MLDPTLNTYALAVAGASGVVAAGAHVTTILTSHSPPPQKREIIGQLLRTFLGGTCTSLVLRWLPWRFDLPTALIVAAVVGGTLGPRGLWWFLMGAVAVVKKLMPVLANVPDPPADDPTPPAPPTAPEPAPEEVPRENP